MVQEAFSVRLWAVLHELILGDAHFWGKKGAVCSGENSGLAIEHAKLLQWLRGEESACNAGHLGVVYSIPWSGRSPGGGNGNPLQDSFPEDLMDRRAWWATEHPHFYSPLCLALQ